MKVLFKLVLLTMVVISITNCKKDNDDFASIVGTWNMTDIHTDNGVTSFDFLGTPVTATYTFHGTDFNTSTTFTENPNLFTSTGSYEYSITTNFLGAPITETLEADANSTGSWDINGDKLTQIIAGDTTVFTIEELSGSKLRLRFDLDETFDDAGTTVHDEATVYSTFER